MVNNEDKVRQQNRLIYFEPNEIAGEKYRYNDEIPNNISWDQDDLTINVDLTVVRPRRDDCGQNDYYKIVDSASAIIRGAKKFNDETGKLTSLFSGTKLTDEEGIPNSLTTNYTDVSYQEITINGARSKENLCVSSIDIDFSSTFQPIVTIKFVDVRGDSLLMVSDWQHESIADGNVTQGSFFGAFFQFPYPRYLLTIKGFYGNRITLSLFVTDFKSEFVSDTGNFNITIKMTGTPYGLYGDLPFNIIASAPYYNDVYWENKKNDGTFRFLCNGTTQCEIFTFPELIKNITNISIDESSVNTNVDIERYRTNQDKINALNEIRQLYQLFVASLETNIQNQGEFDNIKGNNYQIFLFQNDKIIVNFDEYTNYNQAVTTYNTTYNDLDFNTLDELLRNVQTDSTTNELYIKSHGLTSNDGNIFNIINASQSPAPFVKDILTNMKKNGTETVNVSDDLNFLNAQHLGKYKNLLITNIPPNYFLFKYTDVVETINNKISELEAVNNQDRDKVSKALMDAYTEILGFTPTVENMYRMLFAHIDTFMNYYYEKILNVVNAGKSDGNNSRSSVMLNMSYHNSDLPVINSDQDCFVPPFPAYYVTNDNKKCLEYPGKATGEYQKISEIVEVTAVNNMVEKIRECFADLAEAQSEVSDANESSESIPFEPITPLDVYFTGGNPFNTLTFKYDDNFDAFRLVYYYIYLAVRDSAFNITPSTEDGAVGDMVTFRVLQAYNKIVSESRINNLKAQLQDILNRSTTNAQYIVDTLNNNSFLSPHFFNLNNSSDNIGFIKGNVIPSIKVIPFYFPNQDGLFSGPVVLTGNTINITNNTIQYYNKTSRFIIESDDVELPLKRGRRMLVAEGFIDGVDSVKYITPEMCGEILDGHWEYEMIFNKPTTVDGKLSEVRLRTSSSISEKEILRDTILSIENDNSYDHNFSDYYVPYVSINGGKVNDNSDIISLNYNHTIIQSNVDNEIPGLRDKILPYNFLLHREEPLQTGHNSVPYDNWFLRNLCFDGTNTNYHAFGLMLLSRISSYEPIKIFNKLIKQNNSDPTTIYAIRKCDLLYVAGCVYRKKWCKDNSNSDIFYIQNPSDVTFKFFNMGLNQYQEYNDAEFGDIVPHNISTFSYGKNRMLYDFLTSPTLHEIELDETDDADVINILYNYFNNWVKDDLIPNLPLLLRPTPSTPPPVDMVSAYSVMAYNSSGKKRGKIECYTYDSPGEQWLRHLTLDCVDVLLLNLNKDSQPSNTIENNYVSLNNVKSFISQLIDKLPDDDTPTELERTDTTSEYDETSSLYYTLKTLYDKWLCTYQVNSFILKKPVKEIPFRRKRFTNFVDENDTDENNATNNNDNTERDFSEFSSFIYIDQFYNDISSSFLMNPETVIELCSKFMSDKKNVFNYIGELAEKNNLLFMSLPVYNNFYSADSIVKMFSPNKVYGIGDVEGRNLGQTYVIMYTNKLSEHPTDNSSVGSDLSSSGFGYGPDDVQLIYVTNRISPTSLDGFDIKDREGYVNYPMAAFGVTYSKQNQMYFKSINVNMDNPAVTEESIHNTVQISNTAASGDVAAPVGAGQNIYSIYSCRAYTCTVEMLGCMNIMPTMYFQLNNIPMFRGLYMIINVKHSITPGDMKTTFTGVKVSRYYQPVVTSYFSMESLFEKFGLTGSESVVDNRPIDTGPGILGQKYLYITGGQGKHYLNDTLQFMSGLTQEYTVPIHTLDASGNIIEKDVKMTINKYIAGDLLNILNEIYNTKVEFDVTKEGGTTEHKNEYFVIKSFQAYQPRRSLTTKSWHRYGVAIDINNSASNTYNRDSCLNPRVKRGNYDNLKYTKDDNIHIRTWSHPVVRIFEKHGWGWGIYSDSYDYMHFSYMSQEIQFDSSDKTDPIVNYPGSTADQQHGKHLRGR